MIFVPAAALRLLTAGELFVGFIVLICLKKLMVSKTTSSRPSSIKSLLRRVLLIFGLLPFLRAVELH
jgi:hypothetical protein